VAARAGVSPGTLYQFFAGKEALAEALAERYRAALTAAHGEAFRVPAEIVGLPLAEAVDRVVDPLVAVHLAHPGLKVLFTGEEVPRGLAEPTRAVHAAAFGGIRAVVDAGLPGCGAEDRRIAAVVCARVFGSMVGVIVGAPEAERARWVVETKRALVAYLGGLSAGSGPEAPA
jgi:AcrR family transcriptional regulator